MRWIARPAFGNLLQACPSHDPIPVRKAGQRQREKPPTGFEKCAKPLK